MRYDQELFEFVEKTKKKKIAFGEFGMLHRLNLVDILNDIANCRAAIWKDKSASETERKRLRVTLREYSIKPNIIDIHGSKANTNNSSSHPRLRLHEKDGALRVPRYNRLDGRPQ
jgi:hypothetical protein